MKSSLEERGIRARLSSYTTPLAVTFVVTTIILSAVLFTSLSRDDDTFDGQFSHELEIWTEHRDSEYDISMTFYLTQDDAENSVGELIRTKLTIAPSSDDHHTIYLYDIPLTATSVWVVFFCTYGNEIETDSVTEELPISVAKDISGDTPVETLRLSVFN
ncbi:MAG: hypothetical protein ACFFF4_13720 [Candidatus Thorarchaeota archaeon]